MIKRYNSINCVKVNSSEYVSKYIIVNNSNKLYTLLQFNNNKNDYEEMKSTFNYYSFLEYLNNSNFKNIFSEKEFLINEE